MVKQGPVYKFFKKSSAWAIPIARRLSNYESFYKVQTSISAFSRVEKMASESVEGPNFLRCVVPAWLLSHCRRSLEKCQIIEIMHESYVRLVLSMIKYIKSACRHWNVKMKVKVRKRLIQGHLSISTSQCAFTKLPYIRRISMQFVAKKLNTCKYGTKIYWLDSLLLTPIYTIDFWHSLVWNF